MSDADRKIQIATAAAAAALAYLGFRKGGVIGNALGVVGTGIAATGVAAVGGVNSPGQLEVRKSIEVKASTIEVFNMWSRFEDFPRFMDDVIEVRKTGDCTYHWASVGPLGQRVEWNTLVTASEPGRLIRWRSTTTEIETSGEARFEPTHNGTRVFVIMSYKQFAGPIGRFVARATGCDPVSRVGQYLKKFKQLIEAGETNRNDQTNRPQILKSPGAIKEVI